MEYREAPHGSAARAVLVYRRDIAKDVFGTDDPKEVGEKMKDWDTAKKQQLS